MKWRIGDLAILSAILALAAGIWFYPAQGAHGETARIVQDGKTTTVSLSENRRVSLTHAVAVVSDGAIFIEQADCPDQVCVKTGRISKAGESIVCVPNHIVITIGGASPIDAVAN